MSMSEVYPFDMNWGVYTDEELVRAAYYSFHGLDRDDLVALAQELALRVWEDTVTLETTKEQLIEKFKTG